MRVNEDARGLTRRDLLAMVGATAGTSALYAVMSAMGHAAPSNYTGPIKLEGDPKGASVLILGAGLAGLVAAYELGKAGYKVKVLEYRDIAGGRCWTLRAGDRYTDLSGHTQSIDFAPGNYLNPGPWRIPSDHYAVLDYCKRFGVELEPFIQENYNAYLHNTDALGGKPQRFKQVVSDYRGQISELLAKAIDQKKLDDLITDQDAEVLVESLKTYGVLDADLRYVKSDRVSEFRGWAKDPGGGEGAKGEPSEIITLKDIVSGRLFVNLVTGASIDHQATIFQPKGGMDLIAKAFEKEVGQTITYNAKVVAISHGEGGVTATWVDATSGSGGGTETADYCICTIPFSILGQIDHDFSAEMSEVIDSVHYAASIKIGLEFKRRFWEQDEHIYGGITYTNTPITLISYPSTGYFSDGPGVLLACYSWDATAYMFSAWPHEQRIEKALEYGALIHPQYRGEFKHGVSIAWHQVPWTLGCYGLWRDKEADYAKALKMDHNRTLMAGEHISYLPAWQEGAILSGLDAVRRLHATVTAG